MSMTLRFSAWNTQHDPSDYHFTVEPEDLEMGRQIGVLTPRDIIPSDRVRDWIKTDGSNEMDDALFEQEIDISWAQRVSGKKPPTTPQELCDQEIAELEFLLLQAEREGDDIEEMLDTLSLHWEEDMDRIVLDVSAPFGYTAGWNEVLCSKTTQIVRVVGEFQNYFIGSIAGAPPSVYIPKDILPKDRWYGEKHLHSFYLLDLDFTPGLRNQWRATFCHPPLITTTMWQTTEFFHPDDWQHGGEQIVKTTFVIPMPPSYIGAIIGKNGKNIEALIKRVSARTDPSDWVVRAPDPEFTLTPGEDGETIVVDVCRSSLSTWTLNHVGAALDCMHC